MDNIDIDVLADSISDYSYDLLNRVAAGSFSVDEEAVLLAGIEELTVAIHCLTDEIIG